LLERLSGLGLLGGWLSRWLAKRRTPWLVPWDALDLSDPGHPRLRVPREEALRDRAA
jgi:hypothetical protein